MASDRFVSRGGIKLQAALDQFKVDVNRKVVLDVGSSTGGFVDCLLQNGAVKVYALDTAYGELAWKLRNDPRVVVMERTNILHLESLSPTPVIPAKAGIQLTSKAGRLLDPRMRGDDDGKVDLITIDAGWTKLEIVLPIVKKFLKSDGIIIALLKPHYEADKKLLINKFESSSFKRSFQDSLIKGVLPPDLAEQVKDRVVKTINDLRYTIKGCIDSPILGGAGNKEFLLHLTL